MTWNKEVITTIRCFGDSLTAGYGALPEEGWIAQLQKRCPSISFYNFGVCGAIVEDIGETLQMHVGLHEKGNGYFFMGGTNDILCGRRLVTLEKEVEELVASVASQVPLTLGIPPLATRESIFTGWQAEYNFERNQEDLQHYGTFLKELANRCNLPIIDFSNAFPLEDTWYSDGLHPNGKGYSQMALAAERVWKNSEE